MNGIEAVIATQVLDATAVGVALMTAVDAAAARSTIAAVPTARTLTINGTAFDLSADRSWTVAGGISSLNGLTDATQTFQTGTTGTNFGIVSTAGVHTFNMPDAGATARGVVTTGTQTFAGAKTFSDNLKVGSTSSNYVAVGSGTQDVRYGQNGISNNQSGSRYDIISWTGGAVIQAIAITGFAYCGLNIQRAGSGTQSWVTVNFSMPATGASDATPREALDVRGNIIADGNLVLHKGATPTSVTAHNTFTNLSNYERAVLQFVTYASARYAQLACESAGTGIANMNLVLSPKGTGALIAGPMPDGTAVGGNGRGNNAIDLQTTRGAAIQVASGSSSVVVGNSSRASSNHAIAIGNGCISSGLSNGRSTAIGYNCTASGEYSVAIGQNATASNSGCIAIACEGASASGANSIVISSAGGQVTGICSIGIGAGASASRRAQISFGHRNNLGPTIGGFLLTATTTDAVLTGLAAQDVFGSSNWSTLTNTVCSCIMQVLGISNDRSKVAYFTRKVLMKNVGGVITLLSVETIGTDYEDDTNTDLIISNVSPFFSVRGVAGETWRWSAWIFPSVELG